MKDSEKLKKQILIVICAVITMFCGYKIYDILKSQLRMNISPSLKKETMQLIAIVLLISYFLYMTFFKGRKGAKTN